MTIALPHRGWLFDLDGTVYRGETLIPGADESDRGPARGRPAGGLSLQQAARRRGADYARQAHAPRDPDDGRAT